MLTGLKDIFKKKKKSQYIVPLGTKLTSTCLSLRWAPAVCYTNGPLISDTLLPHKGRKGGKPTLFFHCNSQEKTLFLASLSAEFMLILQREASIIMEI